MPISDWPLTSRDDELERVVAAVRSAGGAVLAGPAGVGKTRLAREAIRRAAGPRGSIRWVVASVSAQSVPLGAFAGVDGPALVGEASTSLLARTVAALRGSGLVVGVDDAHLLDAASATLLHQLAAEEAVHLVVTIREPQPAPDAVTALWKDGLLARIDINPLSHLHTGALLSAGLGGPVDRVTVQRLFDATRGNTMWLRMLVEGEQAAGRLVCRSGVWHWAGDPHLSPALGVLVESRLDGLARHSREVLELLSLGEPMPLSALTAIVDEQAVDDVISRDLAVVEENGRGEMARLAHPLFGEALRARISPPRARRLRGSLATTLTGADPHDAADTLRRAVLFVDSDLPIDPDVMLAGATAALELTDAPTAIRLATAARAAGGGIDAHILLAFMLSWTVRPDEAKIVLDTASELATCDEERIRVALGMLINQMVLMSAVGIQEAIDRAAASLSDPRRDVDLDSARAVLGVIRNDLPEAVRRSQRVLHNSVMPVARTYAGWAAAVTAALQGWDRSSRDDAHRSYAACRGSSETGPLELNIAYWEAFGLSVAGHPAAARAASARFDDVAIAVRFVVDIISVPIELASGRVVTAARACRDSLLYTPGTYGGWSEMLHALACQAHAMAGEPAAAAEAWDVAVLHHQVEFAFFEPLFLVAHAWLGAAEGAVSDAILRAGTAAATAARCRQWALEVAARHAAVRFGDTTQAARLAELARTVDGPMAAAAARHAAALAHKDAERVLEAATMFERAGMLLHAADATAQASLLHRQSGATRSAVSTAAHAAELARSCEGARTPALLAGLAPLPISHREREIATLAHLGLTNKQIAQRLQVSVRTVEGHIYRACTKLDMVNRHALAEYVMRLD